MADPTDLEVEPVDLSPLDPARDRARWDQLIASVAARARLRRRPSLWHEVVRRAAPAFAIAAAAAIAVWLARPSPRQEVVPTSRAPADIVTGWALGGGAIDPSELLWSGGDDHEHR